MKKFLSFLWSFCNPMQRTDHVFGVPPSPKCPHCGKSIRKYSACGGPR
jgi:hypothetical protein